jgi:hypothetical protein
VNHGGSLIYRQCLFSFNYGKDKKKIEMGPLLMKHPLHTNVYHKTTSSPLFFYGHQQEEEFLYVG